MDPEAGVSISDIGCILNSINGASPSNFDDLLLCNEKPSLEELEQQTLGGGFSGNCYNVDKEVEIINCQQACSGEQRPVSTVRHDSASAYLSPQCVSAAPSVSRASSAMCGQSPIPVGYPHVLPYTPFPPTHTWPYAVSQNAQRSLVQPQPAYCPPTAYAPEAMSCYHSQAYSGFQIAQSGPSAFQPTQPFVQQTMAPAEQSPRRTELASSQYNAYLPSFAPLPPLHPVAAPPSNAALLSHSQPQPQAPATLCPLPSIEASYSRNPAIAATRSPVPPFRELQATPSDQAYPMLAQPFACARASAAYSFQQDMDVKVKPSNVSPADSQSENRGRASVASVNSASAPPTAKNLLKSRLVERFMQRGEDPHVEEKKPAPPVNTPEVERIRQKRRERNRDAARRTRYNKRRRMAELEDQISRLTEENKKQEDEWKRLSTVLSGLRNRCMNHLIKVKDCPHEAAMRRLVTANLESDCVEYGDSYDHIAAD